MHAASSKAVCLLFALSPTCGSLIPVTSAFRRPAPPFSFRSFRGSPEEAGDQLVICMDALSPPRNLWPQQIYMRTWSNYLLSGKMKHVRVAHGRPALTAAPLPPAPPHLPPQSAESRFSASKDAAAVTPSTLHPERRAASNTSQLRTFN